MSRSSVAFTLILLAILACKNMSEPRVFVPTPSPSPTATPIPDTPERNPAQRLARAAEVRNYLKDQGIPARVVASDLTLKVYYESAHADYMAGIFQTFCQYRDGKLADGLVISGFETVQIEAHDSYGKSHQKTFPLANCKAFSKT
ncbi:MAG: hypothetical protein M3410_18730 [Acidobacteriota bacterium]|nr:hypothetical protein [Acidobacteriota bacterium]